MALVYKKPPMGAVAYMSLYDVVSRRQYPYVTWGYFKGVALQTLPFYGPNRTAQNRLGLRGNTLQIPLVMDTAASKQLRTGTYKLHPPLIDTIDW